RTRRGARALVVGGLGRQRDRARWHVGPGVRVGTGGGGADQRGAVKELDLGDGAVRVGRGHGDGDVGGRGEGGAGSRRGDADRGRRVDDLVGVRVLERAVTQVGGVVVRRDRAVIDGGRPGRGAGGQGVREGHLVVDERRRLGVGELAVEQ